MTTQLPRPIEPGEAQSGDTIERRFTVDGCAITQRMTVARVEGNTAFSSGDYPMLLSDGELILIDRPVPTPARRAGSHWSGSVYEGTVEYVRNQDGDYLPVTYPEGWRVAALRRGYEDNAIAALTPIPDHGDGCSAWLWDEETGTAWVAAVTGNDCVTHVQVAGDLLYGGFLGANSRDGAIAQRLIPWSERGQANG